MAGPTLLVADRAGLLFALDTGTGDTLWTYERLNGFDEENGNQPIVAGDLVFLQGEDATWEAIHLTTGEPRYELPLPPGDDGDEAGPRGLALTGGRAFAATTDGLAIYESSDTEPTGIDSPVDGTTFTSGSFGYSLTWDERWQVEGASSAPDYDLVVLETTAAAPAPAYVLAYAGYEEGFAAGDCAAQISESPLELWLREDFADIAPVADGVPTSGLPPGSDAAVIHITGSTTGLEDPSTALIVCLPVAPDDSWLVFEFYAADAQYDRAVPMFLDLLAGVEPNGGPGTPEATPRVSANPRPAVVGAGSAEAPRSASYTDGDEPDFRSQP